MLTKMTKVSRAFEAQYGREPTLADLAAELNVEPAKIADAYEAVFTHRSLDQPMGDSEGATLGDVLEVGGVVINGWLGAAVQVHMLDEGCRCMQRLVAFGLCVLFVVY